MAVVAGPGDNLAGAAVDARGMARKKKAPGALWGAGAQAQRGEFQSDRNHLAINQNATSPPKIGALWQ
jgi:hypothetical protein